MGIGSAFIVPTANASMIAMFSLFYHLYLIKNDCIKVSINLSFIETLKKNSRAPIYRQCVCVSERHDSARVTESQGNVEESFASVKNTQQLQASEGLRE